MNSSICKVLDTLDTLDTPLYCYRKNFCKVLDMVDPTQTRLGRMITTIISIKKSWNNITPCPPCPPCPAAGKRMRRNE